MTTKPSPWLQNTLIRLDLMKFEDYQGEITELLEEQPYLMGFLFNLVDDFAENTHELLIRSTLALHHSLTKTGLFFKVINEATLEKVIAENVQGFEKIEQNVLTQELYTEESIFLAADSPVALRGLYNYIDENTTDAELPIEARSNLLLVLSVIIELFENAASPEDPEKAVPTDA